MQKCGERIGFTKREQKPILCKEPATVRLSNKEGLSRCFCDACLVAYREKFSMSMGTQQGQAQFDNNFTIERLEKGAKHDPANPS